MNEHSEQHEEWQRLRQRIVGLGKESIRKSYYPELQQRLRELESSEAKYRSLVEDVSDLVWEIDRETRFTYVSPRIRDHLGYEPKDLLGKTPFEFMTTGEAHRVADIILPQITAHKAIEFFDVALLRKDGTTVIGEITARPIFDVDGKFHGYRGTSRNITERKRIEEEKRTFYRETILSVTDGKLDISDSAGVDAYLKNKQAEIDVGQASQLGTARAEIESFCRKNGLSGERLNNFVVGAGEAIDNSLKHAGEGHIYLGNDKDRVWVAVADHGHGIESLIFPKAVLRRGFSTKASLGLGYSIMLHVADQIVLCTGESGTIVVLVENLVEETRPLLDSLPDTWASVPSAG